MAPRIFQKMGIRRLARKERARIHVKMEIQMVSRKGWMILYLLTHVKRMEP
jgi:hypothetical protein